MNISILTTILWVGIAIVFVVWDEKRKKKEYFYQKTIETILINQLIHLAGDDSFVIQIRIWIDENINVEYNIEKSNTAQVTQLKSFFMRLTKEKGFYIRDISGLNITTRNHREFLFRKDKNGIPLMFEKGVDYV